MCRRNMWMHYITHPKEYILPLISDYREVLSMQFMLAHVLDSQSQSRGCIAVVSGDGLICKLVPSLLVDNKKSLVTHCEPGPT